MYAVTPDDSPGRHTELALATAIRKRLDSLDSGNYRRSVRAGLTTFRDWCAGTDIETVADVTPTHLVRWVEDPDGGLRGRVDDGELAPRTAQQYYAYVRASFSWWAKMGYIEGNPAHNAAAEDELPEATDEPDRQYWDEAHIQAVLNHATARVDEALADGVDRRALLAMRDRSLVQMLAYSGARGAELFRDPSDEARDGITWDDIDWERGLIRVLGKTRQPEDALLTDRIEDPLKRYGNALDPASGDWPVFPSLDHATLHRRIRTALQDRGWDSDAIDRELDERDPIDLCRASDIPLPALSIRSARRVMRRLCEAADVEIDGEYLKPHGGRRGLGNRLYDEQAELAQRALRHESVETTHEAYAETRRERDRERVDDVLSGEDTSR